jgi:hypothetical protein
VGQVLLNLSVPFSLESRKLQIVITQGSPDGTPPQKTAGPLQLVKEEDVHALAGNVVLFLVRGYGFLPPGSEIPVIEFMSAHAKRCYLAPAQLDPVRWEDRPKQFVVSCSFFWGGQGHREHLATQAAAVALLGIHTVNVQDYQSHWGGLPPTIINDVLDRDTSMTGRSQAVYRLLKASSLPVDVSSEDMRQGLTTFDFYLRAHQKTLESWAKDQAKSSPPKSDGSTADVVEFALSDEIAWSVSDVITGFNTSSQYALWLENFHTFLESYKQTPADFDETWTSWRDVLPVGVTAATATLRERRLFYWTMRFFQHSASNGHALGRSALESAFQHPLNAFPNWKPDIRWFWPELHKASFDWFTSGRLGAHTLWSEDGFNDIDAQTWSVMGDMLRCAWMLQPAPRIQEFGGYVHGLSLGNHPSGASYKILTLVGHGAKIVDMYAFGTAFIQVDGWSENAATYSPTARALRLLGRAERVLHPGRPDRGKVAILLPAASSLWDVGPTFYLNDAKYLHHALVHAGYTVDFVDDTDLKDDALASRDYTTLYITSPNMSAADLQFTKIADWVKRGGILVVTLGAAVCDEYNTLHSSPDHPSLLDQVLGLSPRLDLEQKARTPWRDNSPVTETLSFLDPTFGSGEMPLVGPVVPLQLAGATMVAQLTKEHPEKPGAGITVNQYGTGRAVAYGFFPGVQYGCSPDRTDPQRLPLRWGKAQRDLAVAPVGKNLADTPRPVRLRRGSEA